MTGRKCGAEHPEGEIVCTLLLGHEGAHSAERREMTVQLVPDPTGELPKDVDGNDITHDIDGDPVVPLVEVEVRALVTRQWVTQ